MSVSSEISRRGFLHGAAVPNFVVPSILQNGNHLLKTIKVLIITQLIVVGGLAYAAGETETAAAVKAGAYYFDGWTGKSTLWHLPQRLEGEFGQRKPIWGWVTSTPEIMRKQIDYAADSDLQFFTFCWYYPEAENKETPLNNALKLFLKAPNQRRMEFCIIVTNHPGFSVGPGNWDICVNQWVELFKHPSYVKANGEPLLIFFSPVHLERAFNGSKNVKAAFERLRVSAHQAGLPGVAIAGCWQARNVSPEQTLPTKEVESGYSFVTGYAMPHCCAFDWPKRVQPWQYLIDGHKKAWDILSASSPLPYIPVATLGWDMRPWEKPGLPEDQQVIRYPDRSPKGVETMVRQARTWINEHATRTTREKILLLYAWNEYGEGGYLTPTEADGDAYLEAVKRGLHSP